MKKISKFKLGSHNTMTYLKPKKWWLYPFRFIARCQSKTIEEQYNLGIRMFDIRVSFDKDKKPEFRHGLIAYKGEVEPIFDYLNKKGDTHVRLVLEEYRNDKSDVNEILFSLACDTWSKQYSKIKFFGGFRKRDGELIVDFKYKPKYDNRYSSCNINDSTGTIWDDWFPWLYARFNNKENIKKGTDKPWLLIDFVNIQ